MNIGMECGCPWIFRFAQTNQVVEIRIVINLTSIAIKAEREDTVTAVAIPQMCDLPTPSNSLR